MVVSHKKQKQTFLSCFAIIMALVLPSCGNSEEASTVITTTAETVTEAPATTEVATETPDTTSPVIELSTDSVEYYQGDDYQPLSYVKSVKDDSGEKLDVQYDDKAVKFDAPGDYIITYTATDSAGNKAEKTLSFKVKKEYSRDEIKGIIQDLIDSEFYTFEFEDQKELGDGKEAEGALHDAISIDDKIEDYITDAPDSMWGSDTNVYTIALLRIFVNEKSMGIKNANTDTLNSELVVSIIEYSGQTKVGFSESIDIVSDKGKMSISSIYDGSTYKNNKKGYTKYSQTNFCFDSEEQISKFKEIVSGRNVSLKIYKEKGDIKSFTLKRNQCDDWMNTIRFYEALNEYVRNIPAK